MPPAASLSLQEDDVELDADAPETRQSFVISAAELAALERDRAAVTPKRGTAGNTATAAGASSPCRAAARASTARSDRSQSANETSETPTLLQLLTTVPVQGGRTEPQRQATSSALALERAPAEEDAEGANEVNDAEFDALGDQLRCAPQASRRQQTNKRTGDGSTRWQCARPKTLLALGHHGALRAPPRLVAEGVCGRCHFQLLVHSYLMCSGEQASQARTSLLQVGPGRTAGPLRIAHRSAGNLHVCVRACRRGAACPTA
jgi:hypothetical protein